MTEPNRVPLYRVLELVRVEARRWDVAISGTELVGALRLTDLLEKYVRRTGVKRGHLVERALLHHLQAIEELPAEYIIHPRIVVSRKTGQGMLRKAENPRPTPALRKLMRDGD